MIAEISFNWQLKPTKKQLKELSKLFRLELKLEESGEISYGQRDHIVDLRKLLKITNQFEVKSPSPDSFGELFDQLERIEAKLTLFNQDQQFNEKVNVNIGGLGLLAISQVEILENCCTSELQRNLEDGWHLIAVCPQPGQRRPDYVVGKTSQLQ